MIIIFILAFISGFSNAIMDTIKHHWYDSIFAEIKNPFLFKFFHQDGWRNKYVDGDVENGRTRVPITFTDAWHFFKSLMLNSIAVCVGVGFIYGESYGIWGVVIVAILWRCCFGIGFKLFYDYFLIRK